MGSDRTDNKLVVSKENVEPTQPMRDSLDSIIEEVKLNNIDTNISWRESIHPETMSRSDLAEDIIKLILDDLVIDREFKYKNDIKLIENIINDNTIRFACAYLRDMNLKSTHLYWELTNTIIDYIFKIEPPKFKPFKYTNHESSFNDKDIEMPRMMERRSFNLTNQAVITIYDK